MKNLHRYQIHETHLYIGKHKSLDYHYHAKYFDNVFVFWSPFIVLSENINLSEICSVLLSR